MAIPTRTFSANVGQTSEGAARGPDAIEADFKALFDIIDPAVKGITAENIADDSITDDKIGDRTPSDVLTPLVSTGGLLELLSTIATLIKAITGETTWVTIPAETIKDVKQFVIDTAADFTAGIVSDGSITIDKLSPSLGEDISDLLFEMVFVIYWIEDEIARQEDMLMLDIRGIRRLE